MTHATPTPHGSAPDGGSAHAGERLQRQPFPKKILRLESLVETCSSCGAWVERYPEYLGEDDNFWQCDRCMCTSTNIRQGRPYGPKSKEWSGLIEQLRDLWEHISPYEYHGIITDPPLPDAWKDTDADIVITFGDFS